MFIIICTRRHQVQKWNNQEEFTFTCSSQRYALRPEVKLKKTEALITSWGNFSMPGQSLWLLFWVKWGLIWEEEDIGSVTQLMWWNLSNHHKSNTLNHMHVKDTLKLTTLQSIMGPIYQREVSEFVTTSCVMSKLLTKLILYATNDPYPIFRT